MQHRNQFDDADFQERNLVFVSHRGSTRIFGPEFNVLMYFLERGFTVLNNKIDIHVIILHKIRSSGFSQCYLNIR